LIRFEIRGDVGVATIDRPERRNALNGELCAQLRDHLVEQSDLRAMVITGAGTAFCAGADLVTRFDGGEGEAVVDTFRPTFEEALDAITDCRVPVIAAVNGPAIGAGMQLAVACDLRIAGPTARFAIPGGKLGVHLSSKNIWRLALLVGQGAARDFLLAGRTVDAADALRLRVVERLSDDARRDALAVADEIAASAPLTMRGHKRALNLVAEAQALTPDARAEIAALERAAFASDDLREGMAAFAEKRAPKFGGR
jgi:enoyl-CoA hydratase/carnithine racemase